MKLHALIIVVALAALCRTDAVSQIPLQSPTPISDTDVVKISTNLIQLDITVTDKNGKPVKDLKPSEIEIFENGEKQRITSLTYIAGAAQPPPSLIANEKTKEPVPQVVLRPEQIRRTIAIVVDDLSLSFESSYQTQRALRKFVDEQMQDGDLVAIIRTGAGIGALQQFTSDKRILYAAIEKVKWNPLGSGGISAFAPIEPTPPQNDEAGEEPGVSPPATAAAQSLDDFRSQVFATGTLGALKYIVTGMSELPGRKSVIMFSDGFTMYEDGEKGLREYGRVMEFLQQLVDTANRSSVVFYTVDARGLAYTGLTAADAPSNVSGQALSNSISGRNELLRDTQDGLGYLAHETGGMDIKNTNDLSDGVRRVLADQSYYLVAYEPDTDTFDPAKRKFNQLSIKVSRPNTNVRYRSGFFNNASKAAPRAPAATTPLGELELALVSPFAVSGIGLRLNALFGTDTKNGPFVRSLLHIDGSDLKFTDGPDGVHRAVIDVLAMSFGDNGQPVDQIAKSYTLTAKGDGYKKIIADGFLYHFAFPVKKPGAYQYRVAIRDAQGGKVGSASQFIEVPNLKKRRLTISSVILENLTEAEWQRSAETGFQNYQSNSMTDTAVRRVKAGTILRYGYEIYNAKLAASGQPNLMARVRIFRDGKLVLDGKQTPVDLKKQTDTAHIKAVGALSIGSQMLPGDYILQIIVTDPLAGRKNEIATQFVQFEITGGLEK